MHMIRLHAAYVCMVVLLGCGVGTAPPKTTSIDDAIDLPGASDLVTDGSLSVGTSAYIGGQTFIGGELDVDAPIHAYDDIIMAPGTNLVLQGTGRIVGQEHVVSIPLFVPYLSGAPLNKSLSTFGPLGPSGIEVQLAGVPVGATVTGIAARVQDTSRTQCAISLVDQHDNIGIVVAPAATLSSGAGAPQTLTLRVAMPVESLHNYWISLLVNNQQDPCLLYALEATYH